MNFSDFKKKYYAEYFAFLGALIWGLFAHGYMLTNKITSNDDLGVLYSTGAGVYNGRWMTGAFANFCLMNMPWFNGIICLLILALSASFIVNSMKIKTPGFSFLIGAIVSTYPVVTSTFLYMFTVVPYMCGFFFAVLASWIVIKSKKYITLQIAVLCIIVSLGFYQGYFPVTASLLLIGLFQYFSDAKYTVKDLIRASLIDLFTLAEGMAGYVIIQKFLLKKSNSVVTSYQNMNIFGKLDFANLPSQIQNAYHNFFYFFHKLDPNEIYTTNVDLIIFVLFAISCFYYIIRCVVSKKWYAAIFTLCISFIFPLSCNLTYLYGAESVHTLMMFGNMCVFVLIVTFLDKLKLECLISKKNNKKAIVCFCCILIGYISLVNCNLANTVYLTQQHAMNATILYCNRMVERIQALSGYRTDIPVCIVGRHADEAVEKVDAMYIKLDVTGRNSMDIFLNTVLYWDWCQETFFRVYLGFGQSFLKQEDRAVISQKSEVQQMPDYPDDGSIAIIDDVIVVHLSN